MDKFFSLPVEKQNKIIDAALTTFGTNGYKKTSVNDIAVEAGISKAMVFHYFGTKKDLYLYLIRYCGDLIMKEVNDRFDMHMTDFFDRIMQASDIKLSVLKIHPAILSFLSCIYFEQDIEVKDDIKNILSESEGFRNKIVFEGMDTTKFKDTVDPGLVMKILLWMAEGFANGVNAKGFTNDNLEESIGEYYACMKLMRDHFYKEEYLN